MDSTQVSNGANTLLTNAQDTIYSAKGYIAERRQYIQEHYLPPLTALTKAAFIHYPLTSTFSVIFISLAIVPLFIFLSLSLLITALSFGLAIIVSSLWISAISFVLILVLSLLSLLAFLLASSLAVSYLVYLLFFHLTTSPTFQIGLQSFSSDLIQHFTPGGKSVLYVPGRDAGRNERWENAGRSVEAVKGKEE
ncbi:hypothetical protein BT69DRAFT_1279330 [Atractiella rhizophila]|nr:hypothetical protein BT69DRAFT_1279330 [Atractiella rhizophila]